MRKRSIGIAALAVMVAAAPQALAFGTIRGLGQNAEHERITRQGLAGFGFGPASLDALAGRNGTFGAVGAPDNPTRGLMSSKAAHCDGGDWFATPGYAQSAATAQAVLTTCRAYIMSNIEAAVNDAGGLVKPNLQLGGVGILGGCVFNGVKGRAKCNVLEDMGLAFHAAQDFYSHSNWIDTPRARPSIADPQGLDQDRPAPWLSPAGAAFPPGLISGCYDGFPESAHCNGRIRHAVLNKDTTGSARGLPAYHRAMAVAAQDTHDKWAYFESQLVVRYGEPRGRKMACVLKSDDPGRC
jgi:hypothetical protein